MDSTPSTPKLESWLLIATRIFSTGVVMLYAIFPMLSEDVIATRSVGIA